MLTDAAADALADDADDEPDHRVDQASSPSGELTPQDILDYAGETDLGQVRELVLRNHGIAEVGATFEPLTSLEVLSLSNNLVHSLAACAGMSRLTTLNINFNRVSSLEPVSHCALLERLFASSNKISGVAPLAACTRLSALSLYRNQVASLDATLAVLERLPALRSLDLGANPCALGPPYRHRIVSALPALETLDGDTLTELDAQLATDFGRSAGGGTAAQQPSVVVEPGASPSRRPTTAPPRSKNLFRDPFLNSNSILLDYLSQAELEQADAVAAGVGVGGAAGGGSTAAEPVMSLRRPMVERLRMTAVAMDGASSSTPQQLAGGALFRSDAPPAESQEQHTIKNLLRLVQELTAERDEARDKLRAAQQAGGAGGAGGDGGGGELEALRQQNAELLQENQNMYAVIDQNRGLTAQLAELRRAIGEEVEGGEDAEPGESSGEPT